MYRNSRKYFFYPFFLISLFLFHAFANYIWCRINVFTPFWDEARHFSIAINYMRSFPSLFINYHDPSFNLSHPFVYGPFFYIAASFIKVIFNIPYGYLVLSNLLFTAILFFSVFKIGERIYGKKTGLFAVLIVSFYPIIYGMSRKFMLDYSLVAVSCLSIYFLIRSDYLRKTKYLILFGISFALGLLIKLSFFLLLIGLICYMVYVNTKEKRTRDLIFNYALFLTMGLLMPLLWYLHNGLKFSEYFSVLGDVYRYLPVHLGPIKLIALAFSNLTQQISIFGLLLLIVSIFCFIYRRRSHGSNYYLVLIWLAVPFSLFLFSYVHSRYAMACLPALAIISSKCIVDFWQKKYVKIFFLSAVFLMIFNFFALSFGFLKDIPIVHNIFLNPPDLSWIIHSPNKLNWRAEDVLNYIANDCKRKAISISLLADTDFVNNETYSYYVYKNNFPFRVLRCVDEETKETYLASDYVVTLRDLHSWHWEKRKKNVLRLNKLLKDKYRDKFKMIKEFKMPSGNIIYLYKSLTLFR